MCISECGFCGSYVMRLYQARKEKQRANWELGGISEQEIFEFWLMSFNGCGWWWLCS